MSFLEMHSLHPELHTGFSSLLGYRMLQRHRITLFTEQEEPCLLIARPAERCKS